MGLLQSNMDSFENWLGLSYRHKTSMMLAGRKRQGIPLKSLVIKDYFAILNLSNLAMNFLNLEDVYYSEIFQVFI